MIKQAVILAAGRGSRMLDRTREKPKCLIPLAGKPLLHWQVQALKEAGVKRVTVVTGYLGETLHGDFERLDNPRWHETNMVSTLRCAHAVLEQEPSIISYSDIVYRPDHVQKLAACPEDIAISYDTLWLGLWSLRFADPLSDAETFRQQDGLLAVIGQRTGSLADIQGQYMGLLKTTPAGYRRIEEYLNTLAPEAVDSLDMTALLSRLLACGVRIGAVPVSGGWCEADDGKDIEAYEKALRDAELQGIPWSHDWR